VTSETTAVDKSGDRVRRMFSEIAPRYDLLNHLLSLNIDRYWRWKTLKLLNLQPNVPFLDVCTGTGDLAIAASKSLGADTEVVGSDFCAEMLDFARKKQSKLAEPRPNLRFVEADTMELPFGDGVFQAVSVAFGLRNVADTKVGLREMMRVCHEGGTVAILEFSKPSLPGLKHLYTIYFKSILPRVGNSVARNSSEAYQYLPQSVSEFPSGEQLASVMREVGLKNVQWRPMTFGVVTLYTGTK